MQMYYFYCPNCGNEYKTDKLPKGTAGNIRGGHGIPIHHYECSICHNLDAGFMMERDLDSVEKEYYRYIIKLYQGIRGFRK